MSLKLSLIIFAALLVITGCSQTTQPTVNSSTRPSGTSSPVVTGPNEAASLKPKLDACALLTSKEIEAVQGEAIKETKLTGQSTSGFSNSQCLFTLPTFSNSISLLVSERGDGSGARDPKGFWSDTFHKDEEEKDKDHDRKNADDKEKGEEEEESAPPQKVLGIGDEAYWTGNRVGGALYVLKENSYIRISIGGSADQTTKIKRSKALAQKVLLRLAR